MDPLNKIPFKRATRGVQKGRLQGVSLILARKSRYKTLIRTRPRIGWGGLGKLVEVVIGVLMSGTRPAKLPSGSKHLIIV